MADLELDFELQLSDALDAQHAGLPDEAQITLWLAQALRGRVASAAITARLVDAAESQALNEQYRGKDKPTNVLSFPNDLPPGVPGADLIGDLVLCVPVIEQEAEEQHKALEAHWAHLFVHGALHLAGFDHIESAEADIMEALEQQILANLGYPDPYLNT